MSPMPDIKGQRKRLTRVATFVALLIAPVVYYTLARSGMLKWDAIALTVLSVGAFRGTIDLAFRHLVEGPLLGLDATKDDQTENALWRRRLAFWQHKAKLVCSYGVAVGLAWGWHLLLHGAQSPIATEAALRHGVLHHLSSIGNPSQLIILPLYFLFNFLILMGPMMATGIMQIRGYEPGDADWGVKLEDVRGQAEAKEEIRKVISLWQAGHEFTAAGGKRERGLLFLGAPGVGKTMLAKGIATGFNCPIVTIPGSGFAQTFIGMDAIIVRYMARKAKKLASRWGGQCIVFIDEIDAVGMRRNAVAGGAGGFRQHQMPGGGMMGGMMGGGGMAINQLLVVMDGIDSPPWLRKTLVNKVNLWLDAVYIVPQRVRGVALRLPRAKPKGDQVYFIGATNVALEALDPALVRPGRMGRHIHFRMPTKRDRVDILDLYLGKVAHEADLDKEELARVTGGYSPAEIEQVCNLALTYAQHAGRPAFNRQDALEAIVTVESGTALGWGYESVVEEQSTAIHEAGHALLAHLYMLDVKSTRLSIRLRGKSGGHHQVAAEEERFFHDRNETFTQLLWGLGAYAAEVVFYGRNTQGVGGDLQSASHLVGNMVGRWGMPPLPVADLSSIRADEVRSDLVRIGKRLLAAAQPTDVKLPKEKYEDEAAILGHAFVLAWHTCKANKLGLEKIAARLIREKEIFGDDVVKLLDSVSPVVPEIDWSDDDGLWPPDL